MTTSEVRTRLIVADAYRWGGGYEELQEVAKELGLKGILFEVRYRHHRESPDSVYPEIVIYDKRYRRHIAQYNDWIIVGPGEKNIRIVDTATYRREYQRLSEEQE